VGKPGKKSKSTKLKTKERQHRGGGEDDQVRTPRGDNGERGGGRKTWGPQKNHVFRPVTMKETMGSPKRSTSHWGEVNERENSTAKLAN